MADIQLFDFEGNDVRTAMHDDGSLWFVAADVCRALEIANSRDAVSRLDGDEKGVVSADTLGGSQEIVVISEPGLYELVLTSRKPEARKFKRWVKHEVLPQIRQTGRYGVPQLTQAELTLQIAQSQVAMERQLLEHEARIKALEDRPETPLLPQSADTGYMTVLAYCKAKDIQAPLSATQAAGKAITKTCKSLSITIGRVPDERWGVVNSYPVELLDEYFAKSV